MTENKTRKKHGFLKGLLKFIFVVLLIVIFSFAGLLVFLSVSEYRPAEKEDIYVRGAASESIAEGDSFSILSWNIGYGALGDNADFFMDGGKMVNTADKERVFSNLETIASKVKEVDPDILLLQEIDKDSSRSKHINEVDYFTEKMDNYEYSFANNFKVAYLPYPIPPIGQVDSGIATYSSYHVSSAERIKLPNPFKWPVRMVNLKRALLINRIPLEDSDKELIIINLHLEAYDSGEGKIEQTKMLADVLKRESENGNYVIAGGDFNQAFSSDDLNTYPLRDDIWTPGSLDTELFGDGFTCLRDPSVPTCRSLDKIYKDADKTDFQYYVIDGYIVSDNVSVDSLQTMDIGFTATDHNPVLLNVTLK